MYFSGLFSKKISVQQGEELLTEYCKVNGFGDATTHWKKPSHAKHWFAYRKQSHKLIPNNWVSLHPIRENYKYTIWIDLVSQEIKEFLKQQFYNKQLNFACRNLGKNRKRFLVILEGINYHNVEYIRINYSLCHFMGNEEVRSVFGHLERMEFMVQPTQFVKADWFFYTLIYGFPN